MHADIAQVPLDRILFDIRNRVQLQRVVADLKTDIGRETFAIEAYIVAFVSPTSRLDRAVGPRVAPLQLRRHIRQLELKGLEVRQSLTELLALQHIITREVEAFTGCPIEQDAILIRPPSSPSSRS